MKRYIRSKTPRHSPTQLGHSSIIGTSVRPAAVTNWRTRKVPLRHPKAGGTSAKATARAFLAADRTATPDLVRTIATFQRILVPVDFSAESTRALKFAAALARVAHGKLILVHVVGPIYELRDYGYGPVPRRRPNEGLLRNARQRIRALGRRHVGENLEWRAVVRSGTAARQILGTAQEFEARLIVMPTRGLSHAPPEEIGSIAERVVRHAPCPILVLPGRQPSKTARTKRL